MKVSLAVSTADSMNHLAASSLRIPRGGLESDVVIVGAGPVGLAVAMQCIGSGLRVLLVETGGEKQDPANFDLATGERAALLNAPDSNAASPPDRW